MPLRAGSLREKRVQGSAEALQATIEALSTSHSLGQTMWVQVSAEARQAVTEALSASHSLGQTMWVQSSAEALQAALKGTPAKWESRSNSLRGRL